MIGFTPESYTDAHGATYEPWSDGVAIGYKVTRNGHVEYVFLNPSSEDDNCLSTVFLYQQRTSPAGGLDGAVIYLPLFVGYECQQCGHQCPDGACPTCGAAPMTRDDYLCAECHAATRGTVA